MSHNNKLLHLEHARKNGPIPRRFNGKPINPSTVWRWIRKGLQAVDDERIRLEVTYVGNTPYVTENAIAEFFQAVTAAKLERHRRAEALAADVTDAELAAAGLQIPERSTGKSVRSEVAQ